MSTYKARQKALRSSTHKFLATSALTAVGLLSMLPHTAKAGNGPVDPHDVIILQNTKADVLEQGYSEYSSNGLLVDNAIQEDIGELGHTHFNAPKAVITGIEEGVWQIHGKLTSTGEVYLLDVNGVLFGKNSTVDVVGLAASTGDIIEDKGKIAFKDPTAGSAILNEGTIQAEQYVVFHAKKIENKGNILVGAGGRFIASSADLIETSVDFLKGESRGSLKFEGFEDGIIVNTGKISVGQAGLAAFVSPFVSNAGVINAKMGTVAIGAGETVTLDLYGDGLVELAVDGELEDALVENTGTIAAEGGKVQISARAAKQAVDNIINVDGIVTASSASVQGGKIVLSGGDKGTVSVKGTVDASGEGGGSIDVTGENITVADTAELKADGGQNGDGGDVKIIASDKAIFRGSASARGGAISGKGGFVETSGHGYIDVAGGTVDTRAADGTKGKWLIDPTDITIIDDNGANPGNTVTGDTSTIGWVQILDALNMSNLTIATTSAGAGTGNITFDDAGGYLLHTGTASSTLEFIADNDIIVNQNINLGDVGTTIFNAAADIIFNANFITSDNTVDATTSGNFEAHAGNDIFVNAGATVGVSGGSGTVILDAANGNGGLSAIEIDGTVQSQDGTLTLNAADYFVEVNATGSVITNGGNLDVNSNHGFDIDQGGVVNLVDGDAHINASTVQLGDDINTTGTITGTATTVAVENNDAQIQDGVDVAASGGTVSVAAGTYVEQVVIDKNLILSGANAGVAGTDGGRGAETIIQSPASLTEFYTTSADNYPVVYVHDASNVVIDGIEVDGAKQGATNYRFMGISYHNAGGEIKNSIVHGTTNNPLNGSQHGNAIYAWNDTGTNTLNVTDNYVYDFQKNGITLNGAGLAGTVSGNVVEGSGVLTSDNGDPAQNGIQIGFGAGGTISGNTISNIGYEDNNGAPVYAASSILLYDTADGVIVENNTINGTGIDIGVGAYYSDDVQITNNQITDSGVGVDAYEAQNIAISGNTFTESGLPDDANHVQVENSTYAGGGDIIDIWNSNTFVGRATVSSDDVNVNTDRIGLTIQGAVDDSNAGANVYVNAATYNENVDIDKSLTLNGARAGENAIGRTGDESVIEGYIRLAGFLDGVTIDGFTIVNQGENVPAFGGQASIAVNTGSQNIEILNNKFDGNGEAASFGVVTSIGGVENVHIQHNDFTDLNGGIYVNPNAVNVDIQQNRFRDNNVGAVVEDGDGDTKVRGNRFINNNEGVVLFGDVDTFRNNRFRGDTQQHIAYLSAAAADLLVDESTGNRFWSDGEYKFTDDMSNDELFALEDQVFHKMDDANNGLVVFKDGELFVTQNSGSIQRGVDASDAGGILWVGDGTFNENVNVWKALTINGDGTVATTIIDGTGLDGHGITVAADNVSLNGMIIENFNGPYYFASGIGVETDVNNLTLNDILSRNNKFAGLYVANLASVNGLSVSDSHFDNNVFGWYFQKDDNSLANTSTVTNVTVGGTSFDSNSRKGLYLEKLDNASFTTIQVLNSGTDLGSPFENAGVDINLKNGNYENIAFDGLTVSGSGVNTAGGKRGSGVIIKARNDGGTYSLTPASLTNVTITNANIDAAGDVGLAFGNNINGGSVTNSTISGPEAVAIYGGASNLTIGGGNTIDADGEGLSSIGLNFGVGISGGSGNIVDDNVITADGIGVAVQDSAGSRVRNNEIGSVGNGPEKGVYADNAADIWVYTNEIASATVAGVHLTNTDGTNYGNDADIWNNTINSATGATGILVENSNFATVGAHGTNQPGPDGLGIGNVIAGGDDGIVISGSNDAMVRYNTVHDVSGEGILIDGGAGVTVLQNDIDDTGENGIKFVSSDDGFIQDNNVSETGFNGIAVIDSDNVTVNMANIVNNTFAAGITLNGTTNSLVDGNEISNTGGSGVWANEADGSTVSGNIIDTTWLNASRSTGSGVHVLSTKNATVSGNTIDNVTRTGEGVHAENSKDIQIVNNVIGTNGGTDNIKGDGVFVDSSDGTQIKGNTITETHSTGTDKGSGIQVINTANAVIGGSGANGNTITNSGWDGIRLQNNSNITVENNSINNTERVGIWGGWVNTALIKDNVVKNDGLGGYGSIHADFGSDWTVTGNDVDDGDFGIRLNGTGGTNLIDDNEVDNVTADGIYASSVSNLTVDANFIGKDGGNVGGNGISIINSPSTFVTDNQIANVAGNGIFLNPSANSTIEGNILNLIGQHGIYLSAGNHGVTVHDNDLSAIGTSGTFNGIHALSSNDIEITLNDITGSTSRLGATGHGIYVNGGTSAFIQLNNITGANATSGAHGKAGAGQDGIHVQSNSGVEVLANNVLGGNGRSFSSRSGGNGANGYGILVNGSFSADVIGNFVEGGDNGFLGGARGLGAGSDGIRVTGSNESKVNTNNVHYVGGNGIYLNPSHNSEIDGNVISNTVLDGIRVISSNGVDITNNNLHAIGMNGIYAENTRDVYIFTNTIGNGSSYGAQQDGIHVNGGRNAEIDNNTIQGADGNLLFLGAGRDGIHVENNREAVITNNKILGGAPFFILPGGAGAGRYGIYADNSGAIPSGIFDFGAAFRDGVRITGNFILNDGLAAGALSDGIHVNNSAGGFFGDRALVELNTVSGVGGNGIFVDNTSGVQVLENTVSLTAADGIHVEDSSVVDIIDNDVTGTVGDGIELARATGFDISENTVTGSLMNGILATDVTLGTIDNNAVSASGIDGVSLIDGDAVTINTNTVSLSGNNGVSVVDSNLVDISSNNVSLSGNHGIFVDPSIGIDIIGNIVTLSAFDGINVLDVLGLNIQDNFVFLSGDDGIDAQTVAGFDISGNVVGLSADNGIELSEAAGGAVENNAVFLSGDDGIDVDNVALIGINGNFVTLSGDDGIDVNNAAGFSLDGNTVIGSSDNGIEISNAAFGSVDGNFVMLSGDDGIEADDILGVSVDGNTVLLSGDDGIDVDNALGFSVDGNTVIGSADNGIQLSDAAFGSVDGNFVTLSGDDGIDADDILGVSIDGNFVTLSGDDGIDVDDALFSSVNGNVVSLSGNNGIEVSDVAFSGISNNSVFLSGNDGINVDGALFTGINDNFVMFSGGDGIDVEDTWLSYIGDNTVLFAADNGIEFQSGGLSVIDDNTIRFVGGDGIYVNPSYFMAITNNRIDFTGDDGIDINDGAFFLIANNEIGANGGFIGDDGIDVDGTSNVTIENNIIQNAAEAGIELTDTDLVNILFNSISDNGDYGLWVRGADNLSVVLSGNTFTDNPTGARFESGAIDLRGAANSFINTNPLGTPIGMQFDEAGTPGSLTIVGNTLGSTIFDGFGNLGSYYVRIEDGTLLDTVTGDPIVINGLNASFDGLVPASFGGILTLAQLNFIENRLHDADDAVVNGRGQIFVGSTLSLDVEEFFNQFGFFGPGVSGFNLTFLGLPPVTLPTGNLNNIQTFAGPGDLNNISPAAGEEGDAESLADIEPAAGGEETSCWTDIWNAPVNGGVNFNYSGDPTESLNAAASCGS